MPRSKGNKNSQRSRGAAQQTLHSPLSTRPKISPLGPPRLDKQVRLLHLFYEVMTLLFALGQTRSEHIITSTVGEYNLSRRRQFLNDLAYICDLNKGGLTTSAIAVEDRTDQYIFWFALNATSALAEKVRQFLSSALGMIQQSLALEAGGTKDAMVHKFTIRCIEASSDRIKGEIMLVLRHIKHCREALRGRIIGQEDQNLLEWMADLEELDRRDHFGFCSYAYDHRLDPQMRILRERGEQQHGPNAQAPEDRVSPFSRLQHYIGRLADHMRRPKRLIEHSDCFQAVLENPYMVRQAPSIPGVTVPEPDGLTTLDNMVKRMVTDRNRPRLGEYQTDLRELDRRHSVLASVKEQYGAIKPCVHAEVQVLEHFWSIPGMAFAFGDRFIGCSKPACYCCRRYIEHHPLRCVIPDSHEKIWPNWSPPLLGVDDPRFLEKKIVIQSIIGSIREDALQQISQRRWRVAGWHPDSVTGITTSVVGNGSIVGSGQTQSILAGALEARQTPHVAGFIGSNGITFPTAPIFEDDTEPDSDAFARLDLSSSPDDHSIGSPATSISSAASSVDVVQLELEFDSDSDDGGGVLLYGPSSRQRC